MKASSVFRSPLFVKGADIGTTKTLAEADLNKCHQVTAGVVVTIPTPLTMKAQAGDMVMLFNSSAVGASVALGAGASFLNHSGSVPLTPGVAVLLVAYSDSAWTIAGVVPAVAGDITAGTDVKKFINPKEHLSFHQADITKLAGIATGANLYVHPNHSGDVTSVADGAQTIAANAVTNMKLADMANATIKGRVTAGAGDPEDLTAAQARSILNVADGAQKNSDITKAEIEAKLTGVIATHSHTVADSTPAGTVAFFGMNSAPSGWLKANGAAVSRTTYAALFAAIGTTFGAGDGSTTFNLPDMRGYFPRGFDDGRGIDSGRVFGSTQADELKSHYHSISGYESGSSTNNLLEYGGSSTIYTVNTNATGGVETRPKNIALMCCIKF